MTLSDPLVSLFSCPFCHEVYPQGESHRCVVCGIELAPHDARSPHERAEQLPVDQHEDLENIRFSVLHVAHGRGVIALLALAGLALFACPWIRVTVPDTFALSGLDLAQRLGWSWGTGVAWLVLIPVVVSRRTLRELRGARVAAGFLSAIPAITVGVFLARPPQGRLVHVRFDFAWPLFATLVLSIVSVFFAVFRLGRSPGS